MANKSGRATRKIARRHEWIDADGKLAFVHVKYDNGEWGYRSKQGGKWVGKKPDIAASLMWNMPDLLAALDSGDDVFWCAGEKDADAYAGVLKAGEGVTTSVHQGEKAPVSDEQFELFRGTSSHITIIGDRDPTGYKNVLHRYDGLRSAGVPDEQLEILLPAKSVNDVAEHIEKDAGGFVSVSPAKLRERLSQPKEDTPGPTTSDQLARFQEALRDAGSIQGTGQDWTCPHPDHDDSRPSFGVKVGRDGGLVLNCQSCMPETGTAEHKTWLVEVLDALGLDRSDIRPGEKPQRWRWISAAELATDVPPQRWMLRGALAELTHGVIAGKEKALKSYFAYTLALAVASGRAFLDHWEVKRSGPVVVFVGEGGRLPTQRRLQRIAKAYGLSLAQFAELPLYIIDEIAPIDGKEFQNNLAVILDELKPVLVILDPLYMYHPQDIDAGNLYKRGPALGRYLSKPCADADASFLLVDHWKKNGTGGGFDRISMAGVKEWMDSWAMLEHDTKTGDADPVAVEIGEFKLKLRIGSRQWGERYWSISYNVGMFDEDLGDHIGDISWSVEKPAPPEDDRPREDWYALIRELLQDHPDEYSKTKALEALGAPSGRRWQDANKAWGEMAETYQIEKQPKGTKWHIGRGVFGLSTSESTSGARK